MTNLDTVVVGGFYEPSLLPDYSPDIFRLVKNKLVQHDISDIDNCLIPAWKIEQGLRPGMVILVLATLHIYNIDNTNIPGFRRVGCKTLPLCLLTLITSIIKSTPNVSKCLQNPYLKNKPLPPMIRPYQVLQTSSTISLCSPRKKEKRMKHLKPTPQRKTKPTGPTKKTLKWWKTNKAKSRPLAGKCSFSRSQNQLVLRNFHPCQITVLVSLYCPHVHRNYCIPCSINTTITAPIY